MFFWDNTHQTFHPPCGVMTPTLFDIATIVGLKHTGETFEPTYLDEDSIDFGVSRAAYNTDTEYYLNKKTDELFDRYHIAFLGLWLCRYVFCLRSVQIA